MIGDKVATLKQGRPENAQVGAFNIEVSQAQAAEMLNVGSAVSRKLALCVPAASRCWVTLP
jgi:hypothetical protein